MTKKELEIRMKQLYVEIRDRENELLMIRKEYAANHAPFKVGDRVVCKGKEGIISEVTVSGVLTASFNYRWRPINKNGSLSYERDLWEKFEKV